MKFQLKKIKDCKHALKIEVDEKQIGRAYEEVFRAFQKKAKLKGFREGKAPLDMVRATFKAEAEEEVVRNLIAESYYEALRESKLSPVGSPDVQDLKMDGKKLSFTAEFENFPLFNLKNYKGLKVQKPAVEIPEEEITKTLDQLRQTRAKLEPIAVLRPAQEGDVILCDVDIHQNGQYTPGKKDILFGIDREKQPDIAEQIAGADAGTSREIFGDLSPEEKEQGIVGRKPLYRIHVKEIRTKVLPEINDELAAAFGKANVEELKKQISDDIRSYRESQNQERMKESIYEQLIESYDIQLPEALVERQKSRLLEQLGVRPEEGANGTHVDEGAAAATAANRQTVLREADDKAKNQVKLFFILEKIAQSEKIEPTDEEIETRVKELAAQTGRPEEDIRRVFEDDIYQNLRQSKTAAYLLANASVKEDGK